MRVLYTSVFIFLFFYALVPLVARADVGSLDTVPYDGNGYLSGNLKIRGQDFELETPGTYKNVIQYLGNDLSGMVTGISVKPLNYDDDNMESFFIYLCEKKQNNQAFNNDLINCGSRYLFSYNFSSSCTMGDMDTPGGVNYAGAYTVKAIDTIATDSPCFATEASRATNYYCHNMSDDKFNCSRSGFAIPAGHHVYVVPAYRYECVGNGCSQRTPRYYKASGNTDNIPGSCFTGTGLWGNYPDSDLSGIESSACSIHGGSFDWAVRLNGSVVPGNMPLPDINPISEDIQNTYIVPGSYSPGFNYETGTTTIDFSFDYVLGEADYKKYDQYPVILIAKNVDNGVVYVKNVNDQMIVDYNLLRPVVFGPIQDEGSFPDTPQTFEATITVPYLGASATSSKSVYWYPIILNVAKGAEFDKSKLFNFESAIEGEYHHIFWEGTLNYSDTTFYGPDQFFATSSAQLVYECDPDSDFWSRSICLLLVKITQPSMTSIMYIQSVKDDYAQRAPFVHVHQITSMMSSMYGHDDSTASSSVSINIPMIGQFEVVNRQMFADLPFAEDMRKWVAILICFMTAFQVYRRGVSVFSNRPETV